MDAPRLDLLDQYGPLLNAQEMARVFGRSLNAFYKLARRGAFDLFRVHPPIGSRCYSKALVARYLGGEDVSAPARVFGRKRA